jgi:hypothetical protein
LKHAFTTLAHNGEEVSEQRKLRLFAKTCLAPELKEAMTVVAALPEIYNTVEKAMTYVSTVKSSVQALKSTSMTRTLSNLKRDAGDDEQDLARSYTTEEWHALSYDEKQKVREARERKKKKKRKKVVVTDEEEEVDEPTTRRGGNDDEVRNVAAVCQVYEDAVVTSVHSKCSPADFTRAELDSHADTCLFGRNAYVVKDTGNLVSVKGFVDILGTVKHVPVVTAVIAYDDPRTLTTYALFFHQVLYFQDMDKHLLCPSQLRSNHIIVNDIPLLYIPEAHRTLQSHSIISEQFQA